MSQGIKSLSLVSLMLLSALSGMVVSSDFASANTVVITEPQQIVDGGSASDTQAAIAADSQGNVHIIWARNNLHLYYSMVASNGEVLIDSTQITNAGIHKIWHPDMVADDEDNIHIVWTDKSGTHKIMYTALSPYKIQPFNGQSSTDNAITGIDDTVISQRAQDRDWASIDVDSQGNVHIAWEDEYDELEKFFNQPQIYYTMLQPDFVTNDVITLFDDTLLTPIIGHKGHPDITVDANDLVQIAWDDTRGGKVELVFVIDTSGSMYTEWADVCTVIYGGTFSDGSPFEGIKPLLETANMTVYETIYGITAGFGLPSAADSGDCAGYNQNSGPRSTPLGDGDDSGGIRSLSNTVYNGNPYSGNSGEDWGPGTNWACLSWKDNNGNVPGNPPTSADHKWNPNATKIVLPVSDEGPKDGDPSQQADDINSIDEAHDSCVKAGVIPIGLYGQGYGGAGNIQSHFLDLVKCPNGVVSTQTRNCPGSDPSNNPRTVNAGGQAYEFPSGGSGTGAMALLVEAMVYVATNNSREIYMTVLDPYGKMQNDPLWTTGSTGHSVANGGYVEDTGPGAEGHLVVVNDTRVTIDDAYSFHPSIGVDMQGNTHIAWMDARDYGFEKSANYEVYYTKLRLQGAGAFDGAEEGLSPYAIKKIDDTAISNVEGLSGLAPNRPWSGHSIFPALLTDDQNNVHISWIDSANTTAGEEIQYTKLNQTDLTGEGTFALDPWEIVPITSWASNKLGTDTAGRPEIGMPPAFANDLGSGAHVGWSDRNKCNDEQNGAFTICYSHVLTGQVDVELDLGETFYHVIEPGEQTVFNMTVNNSTPGDIDLVADTYGLNITGVPANWSAQLFFASNQTQILPTTPIFMKGGEFTEFYLRIQAPTIYQANEDELAQIVVTAKSYKDPAIRSDLTTLTLMDVVHGISLDTSLSVQDIEQGGQATFSITITNTGNVQDSFLFWDPNTLEGQQEWLLPFGWEITFPLRVELDPGKSTTKILTVKVPTTEQPGAFVIYLKGWSEGEPIKSVDKGTYDILELGIYVSIKSEGNIVFEATDRSKTASPGDCVKYYQNVTKNFETGNLIFSIPGAPEAPPEGVDITAWRETNWYVTVDFANAPGTDTPLDQPREWRIDPGKDSVTYQVVVNVCAPASASAGLGPTVTLKANLEGYQKVSDSKRYDTNVEHVYALETEVSIDEDKLVQKQDSSGNPVAAISVNPGENIVLPTTVMNTGNGPDRFDYRLTTVTDPSGIPVRAGHWDIVVPRETLQELSRDSDQTFDVLMNVPDFDVSAGLYVVEFKTYSEEDYPDEQGRMTKLRNTQYLYVYVNEFYDMEISMDPTVDNPVKISAPGKIVSFTVNITNNGNVEDWPKLSNHTAQNQGNSLIWSQLPGMGALDGWSVEWRTVSKIGNDLTVDVPCVQITQAMPAPDASASEISAFETLLEEEQDGVNCAYLVEDDVYMMPKMAPYQTIEMVAVVSISPTAKLDTRYLGLKVNSKAGDSTVGGDFDDTPSWQGEELDSNEFIVSLRLKAPDLLIKEIIVSTTSAEIDSTIPIGVVLHNVGNTIATDIEIVLCQYDDADDQGIINDIKKNGCDEESIVMRQVIGALLAPDATEEYKEIEIYLLYPVVAGSKGVYVVVDPMNRIVEGSESNNIKAVPEPLESPSPFLDVASQVVAKTALPFIVVLLTLSLLGVVYVVGKGRREEANKRIAEQSSLISVMGSKDD